MLDTNSSITDYESPTTAASATLSVDPDWLACERRLSTQPAIFKPSKFRVCGRDPSMRPHVRSKILMLFRRIATELLKKETPPPRHDDCILSATVFYFCLLFLPQVYYKATAFNYVSRTSVATPKIETGTLESRRDWTVI
ncbi:unnamed protein product [Schistocephalus solidus]|uniref:Uncharacterized protein n=1 Tax=Schistocephalus solidus TaxID=70667 RepID=A0A3P7D0K3_SCHSO|nr:unnamed protein product [Schistocephalus solidus]